MPVREKPSPERQSMRSLKAALMIATVIAGFWSLMSGTFFLMTLRAAGLLA